MRKKIPKYVLRLVILSIILSEFSEMSVRSIWRFLFWNGFSGLPRSLAYLMREAPGEFAMAVIYALLILWFIITGIRLVVSIFSRAEKGTESTAGKSTAGKRAAGERTAGEGRSYQARPQTAKTVSGNNRSGNANAGDPTTKGSFDGHVILSGRRKYLAQLDGYLKSGLIDRKEYNQLYRQYSQIDVPDNYL